MSGCFARFEFLVAEFKSNEIVGVYCVTF